MLNKILKNVEKDYHLETKNFLNQYNDKRYNRVVVHMNNTSKSYSVHSIMGLVYMKLDR